MKKQHLSRRGFLTGLGGMALALPWLERFERSASAAPVAGGPKRIIVVTYQMGIPGGQWRPSATGSTFTLPYVTAPLDPFRSRCLFVSDLDHTLLEQGGNAYASGHPGKCEAALTGTLTSSAFPTTNSNHVNQIKSGTTPSWGANAASIDHLIGRHLHDGQPMRSVDLSVDGALYAGGTAAGASRFFFEGRDTPVSLVSSPLTAMTKYFANVAPAGDVAAEAALRALRERNKSVLDGVRESYADVARDLGADDRRRLEEHASRIREIELDATAPSTCAKPTSIVSSAGQKMNRIAATQIRILAQAMACDVAPVGRLEFSNQHNPRFGISTLDSYLDGAGTYTWHDMVHGTPRRTRPDSQGVGDYDQKLLDGYRFFVQQFANLLAALDSFPEGTGKTVLDNSLVILATDFGEGLGHFHGKMGFILAGNLGGARRNYHFRGSTSSAVYTASKFEVVQLLNSICDMVGYAPNGAPASVGLQGYLSKVGRPRRIDGLFA